MNKAITSLKELASVGSRAGLCLAAALSVHAAAAADWVPGERITLVSQSSPGTGNELMLRELADIWNKNNFVPKLAAVENVVGSQGEKMRRYMITQNRGNPHFIAAYTPSTLNSPLLMKSDTRWKQFTMVANLANDPAVLLVNAEGPYKSLKDLVAAAKDKPKQLLQGGGAYGSSASMAGKLLEEATGSAFSYTPCGFRAAAAVSGGAHLHRGRIQGEAAQTISCHCRATGDPAGSAEVLSGAAGAHQADAAMEGVSQEDFAGRQLDDGQRVGDVSRTRRTGVSAPQYGNGPGKVARRDETRNRQNLAWC